MLVFYMGVRSHKEKEEKDLHFLGDVSSHLCSPLKSWPVYDAHTQPPPPSPHQKSLCEWHKTVQAQRSVNERVEVALKTSMCDDAMKDQGRDNGSLDKY